MERRSFLQMIGMAPAVIATSSVNTGPVMESVNGLFTTGSLLHMYETEETGEAMKNEDSKYEAVSTLVRMRRRLKDALRRGTYHLDPDLQANRSFSLVAKYRIQLERDSEQQ